MNTIHNMLFYSQYKLLLKPKIYKTCPVAVSEQSIKYIFFIKTVNFNEYLNIVNEYQYSSAKNYSPLCSVNFFLNKDLILFYFF